MKTNDLWVDVDGSRIHFVQTGDGPPILLIPGWPQSWYAWRAVMPLLAKSGRRAIACDLPGLGDSDLLPGGIQYDTGGIADILAKALRSLGVTQADVVGHDVGTWIAFAYATRHPDAVRRLVLSEAEPFDEDLVGPSSGSWGRAPGEAGRVAFFTTDGGTAALPPDGLLRPAKVLRVTF